MAYTINTRRTSNGWVINLVRIGEILIVTSHHDKRRGTSTRYTGKSMDKAIECFLK
jgi:hypothetical protein